MQQTQIKHEEQILEAIDQLRRRKARPDADRICNYLLRKFSVDARDTIADLHRLIEAEKVIQVDYKGNTSYRNALKWTRLQLYKNRPEGFVKEKLNSAMVNAAFGELVIQEPDYLDQGVPGARLVEQLLDGISNPTSRRMVEDFLSKEVASGNLIRLVNGNYSLGSTTDMATSPQQQQQSQVTNKRKSRSSYDFDDTEEAQDSVGFNTPSPKESETRTGFSNKQDEVFHVQDKSKDVRTEFRVLEQARNGGDCQVTNLKKAGKSERKQRLFVRKDDTMDLEIKFENFERKENGKEEVIEKKEERERFSEEREDEDAGRSSANPSPTPSNNNVGGFRSARRKRAKKVFDPSDNNLVKRKRGRHVAAQNKTTTASQETQDVAKPVIKDGPNRQCSLCAKDRPEALIACRDCTVRAHPSCIYSPDEILHKINSGWQCERCKSCVVCCETSDAGPLVTCFTCDEAYHYLCHTPRILIPKSHSKWQCNECSHKQYKFNGSQGSQSNSVASSRPDTPNNSSAQMSLPPVLSPQVSPTRGSSDAMDDDLGSREGIDPNIPDASDWTSEQVYQYFARLFPKEAEIFRHHDIDGHSLLLMKRSDVLSGMELLLGPALKIYRHVLKLQVRRDDPQLYWL